MQTLENYTDPICNARIGSLGGGKMRDNGELNPLHAAAFCEEKFGEWDHRTAMTKRFRSLMWKAAIMKILRRAVLEADEKERPKRLEHGESLVIKGPLTSSPTEAVGTPAYLINKDPAMTDVDRCRAAFTPQPSFEGKKLS
ncbi:hypothetical protein BDR04DRAFT_64696 [Suillus decipiens]|nr:hypothetical protein BDR04DRAFT_64696 [Suillus decipiens]